VTQFTPEQVQRFTQRFGPVDAERRMLTIGYMYLAARQRLLENPREPLGPNTFLLRAATAPASPAYPHPDQPWLLFCLVTPRVQLMSSDPFVPFDSPQWVDVADVTHVPPAAWVRLSDPAIGPLPLALQTGGSGDIYGHWL